MFHRAEALHPGIATLPGRDPSAPLGPMWLVTTAVSVALGTYVFPHMFQLCFSASNARTIRRNAIFQPLYSLSYYFIILLGLAALVADVSPPNGDSNAVLLQLVAERYPAWVSGLLVGTVALLALVPGSMLLLTIGSIFARNVALPLRPTASERQLLNLSRAAMVAFAAVAAWLSIGADRSLVQIGLAAYATIGMLAPGIYLGFLRRRTSADAVLIGLVVGYAAMLVPGPHVKWFERQGIDLGLAAMAVNALVVLLVDSLGLRWRLIRRTARAVGAAGGCEACEALPVPGSTAAIRDSNGSEQ